MTATTSDPPPRRSSRLPLILGLFLALAGGGGGFLAVRTGLLPFGHGAAPAEGAVPMPPLAPASFVTLDPLVISLPRATGRQFLRIVAALDVPPEHAAEVGALSPRIIDVMNGYLRAVEPADFEDRAVLARLRAQLLRRIQVVAGEGRVRDLLILEFVLT
jgi:flagellar FliL protein